MERGAVCCRDERPITVRKRQPMSVPILKTDMVFAIWSAMFGNGSMTGIRVIRIGPWHQRIRKVLRKENTKSFAAVPISSLLIILGPFERRIAMATALRTGTCTILSVFGA